MDTLASRCKQYQTVALAIRYIKAHQLHHPSLAEIAQHLQMSEHYLQRLFTQWAGLSPKRFLQFLTKENALQALASAKDIHSVSDDMGLSSSSRLHDLMINCEAMTPGEIKNKGENLTIEYGEIDTPFGQALIAWTHRGICYFAFFDQDSHAYKAELQDKWPRAQCHENAPEALTYAEKIFNSKTPTQLNLLVSGTNFQIKVWEALLKTRRGERLSYTQLAQLADSPKAQRAVGSAMAANTIGFLIPCHRIIRESGDTGHYRWNTERKIAIQVWEAGH